jgi:hypothetical protein
VEAYHCPQSHPQKLLGSVELPSGERWCAGAQWAVQDMMKAHHVCLSSYMGFQDESCLSVF